MGPLLLQKDIADGHKCPSVSLPKLATDAREWAHYHAKITCRWPGKGLVFPSRNAVNTLAWAHYHH